MATWASLDVASAASLEGRCSRALGRARRLGDVVKGLGPPLDLKWFMGKARAEGCAQPFTARNHKLTFGVDGVDTFLDLLEHRLYTDTTQGKVTIRRRADRFSNR
jgi:hypothetical protein